MPPSVRLITTGFEALVLGPDLSYVLVILRSVAGDGRPVAESMLKQLSHGRAPTAFVRLRMLRPQQRSELGCLIARVEATVHSYCRRRVARELHSEREEIAERVSHEITVKILRNEVADLDAAFWTVVRHRLWNAIESARRKRETIVAANGSEEDSADPLYGERQILARLAVWSALETLPSRTRSSYLLHAVLGFPISTSKPAMRSVTKILGNSDASVRRWVAIAEEAIRNLLENSLY